MSAPPHVAGRSAVIHYLDVVLVVLAAAPALVLGAPALGYGVGAAAWILQRIAAVEVDRRLAGETDLRRRLGFGVASSILRVWLLAATIVIVGVAGTRADGLTAALLIFGAFSTYFLLSAIAHRQRKRGIG